jgi:hypothetical protein
MAITNDEEDQTKNMFRAVGGGTSYIGGGYGGGAAQQQAPRETQGPGTGFTNIQEYLKGPERSAQAGGEIAASTDKMGQDTLGKINNFQQEGSALANVPEYDSNVGGNWLYNVSTAGTNEGQKAEFKEKVPTFPGGAMINGYADVGSFQPAQAAATGLGQRLGANKTESGLQTQFQGTPGEQRLSTALAMNPMGRAAIEGQQQKWGQVNNWLGKAQTGVQNQITAGKENAAKWDFAAQKARDKASETNKYWDDLATTKQRKAQEIAQNQPSAEYGSVSTPAVVPVVSPEKRSRVDWIGQLQPGGLREGHLWSQADINNYIATGQKPQRDKVTSTGTYSTPEGIF